ncbi:MAG TPA: DUF4038 domain-containing protein [Methylobacter sp.]|jgi:hypothetical protein
MPYSFRSSRPLHKTQKPSGWFPLSVSSNGRYLVDVQGRPFIGFGEAAWQIVTDADSTDIETYFADRRSRGFNMAIVQITSSVKYVSGSAAPGARAIGNAFPYLKNTSGGVWDGDPTFTHFDADFSSPNDAYWDWFDTIVRRAEYYGFVLVVDPIYWGFNLGAADGWYQTIGNSVNTQSVCLAHGQYLGARWKNHTNLILSMGTDTFPTPGSETSARIAKLQDGLISAGCHFLTLAHLQRSSGSLDHADFASYMTVRGCYTGTDNASAFACNYARMRQEFAASPTMPVICVESNYEVDRTRTQLRTLAWQGILSSIAGYAGFGNDSIAAFNRTTDTINTPGVPFPWQNSLSSNGSLDLQTLWTFVTARGASWPLLEPRGLGSAGTLVTAGGGTLQTMASAHPTNNATALHDNTDGQDYVTAARATDGSLVVAYLPPSHTGSVTIDMTTLRGTVTARWFDPTNGTYSSIGSFSNTGTQAFTTTGNNAAGDADWVLILEA